MTVNANPPRQQHVTDGIQDTFAFNFRVLEDDDVLVFLNQNTTPESPATYTVNLSATDPPGQTGGNVVMNTPPATGTLTITRATDQTQDTDYVPFDPFPAESHELGLDKAMMVAQEVTDLQSRVFLAAPGYDPATLLVIPDYDEGKFLQWSVNAVDGPPPRLVNAQVDAAALAQAVLDAQTAATAAAGSAAAAAASAAAAAASAASASSDASAAAASAASAAGDAASASADAASAAASAASALSDAAAAAASAAAAAASAASATTSAANAATSETNAATSAANAATSEANAATSETNAATSAANAATSEANAATSETNAAASAAAAAASAAVAAFFDVSTFDSAPTVSGVLRHVMTRSATYDFDGIAARGFANVAPSASTVFTVTKELLAGGTTTLGTMSFAMGSNNGVWADVAGTDVTFAAGDRVEITAPGALNGIQEVAITVPLVLP